MLQIHFTMSVICAEISVLALATLSLDFFISPNILSKLETKILKYFANISISSFDLISRRLVRSPCIMKCSQFATASNFLYNLHRRCGLVWSPIALTISLRL